MVSNAIADYPRSFFDAIIAEMPERLKEFFLTYKEESGQSERKKGARVLQETFDDIVIRVLKDELDQTEGKRMLSKLATAKFKQYNLKKKRWMEAARLKCVQMDISDKQHPFHYLYELKKIIPRDAWSNLYGKKTMETIVAEQVSKIEEWAVDPQTLLVEFPALRSYNREKIYRAMELDCLNEGLKIIKEKWDFDLSSYVKTYVDAMEGSYFTASKKKYSIDDDKDMISLEIPIREDDTEKMFLTISKEALGSGAMFTALDVKDQSILFEIVSRATHEISPDRPMAIELGDLAKIISRNNKPSKKLYNEAEKRCYKLAAATYRHMNSEGKQIGAINYLGSAFIENKDGKDYMNITLGPVISSAILMNKVRRMPSDLYDRIEDDTAKSMILSIARERIKAYAAYKKGAPDCSAIFSFNDILMMANYGTNNRSKIKKMVAAAFDEFITKKVLIENYRIDSYKDLFRVDFIPLTAEEAEEAGFYGYRELEQDIIDQ